MGKTKYEMLVIKEFRDLACGNRVRGVDDKFVVFSAMRARKLASLGLAAIVAIKHSAKKTGNKVIIYQRDLYKIGGIETWCRNIAKLFADRNITFIISQADIDQLLSVGKYCDVVVDDGELYEKCDVLIISSCLTTGDVIFRIESRKCYQMVHADFSYLTRYPAWDGFRFGYAERRDRFISVSETAKKGLLKAFNEESVVIENPIADDESCVFITLSRASSEKGIERIVKLARQFEDEGRDFVWFLCSTLEQCEREVREAICGIPEIVVLPPGIHNQRLIRAADYLVQLSDNESYCYSMHEALRIGVPVIATDFDEARRAIQPGKNGYLLKMDLSGVDSDAIFSKRPKPKPIARVVDKKWDNLLGGKL